MLAQSFLEYGALASISAGVGYLAESIRTGLGRVGDTTWVTIGGAALLLVFLWNRRSSRF